MKLTVIAVIAAVLPLSAQMGPGCCCGAGGPAAIVSNPVVQVTGIIEEVHIALGQGMPYIEVKSAYEKTRVYLGSMRYLIAENFSPKAGQPVTLKGYKSTDAVIAIEVTLTAEKKTLKLRDEKGWPLWMGGPHHHHHGRGANQ